MRLLYTHADPILVGHFASVLEERGVACHVRNEMLGAGVGELPACEVWPELWVLDDHHFARATEILEAAREDVSRAQAANPWQCPQCGETIEPQFTQCWQCAAERDSVLDA